MGVTRTAMELGYRSVSAFTYSFRIEMKYSPRAYMQAPISWVESDFQASSTYADRLWRGVINTPTSHIDASEYCPGRFRISRELFK